MLVGFLFALLHPSVFLYLFFFVLNTFHAYFPAQSSNEQGRVFFLLTFLFFFLLRTHQMLKFLGWVKYFPSFRVFLFLFLLLSVYAKHVIIVLCGEKLSTNIALQPGGTKRKCDQPSVHLCVLKRKWFCCIIRQNLMIQCYTFLHRS